MVKRVALDQLKGKTLFINHWATWCHPCVEELPEIQKLFDSTKDKGVEVLCISPESSTVISSFVKKKGYTFPVYAVSEKTPGALKVSVFPTTVVVSPEGEVVHQSLGEAKWADPKFLEYLRSLSMQTK